MTTFVRAFQPRSIDPPCGTAYPVKLYDEDMVAW